MHFGPEVPLYYIDPAVFTGPSYLGSVPRFTTDARFRGSEASLIGYFRYGPQWLVLDLQYSTFKY